MNVNRFIFVLLVLSFCFFAGQSIGQRFLLMTDEERIQLALDKLRKGIQHEDTTKVSRALGSSVSINSKKNETREFIIQNFQNVFSKSTARKMSLPKPTFPRENNPLRFSNLWDFDILSPVIKIEGDSAFVDCELVLWGGGMGGGAGLRIKESLILAVPKSTGKAALPEDFHKWPESSNAKDTNHNRQWHLVAFENLLDFLESQVSVKDIPKGHTPEGKK